MKKLNLDIDLTNLGWLLNLPSGIEIASVSHDVDREVVTLHLRGDGLPGQETPPGSSVVRVHIKDDDTFHRALALPK
jgi:hypothetical protein